MQVLDMRDQRGVRKGAPRSPAVQHSTLRGQTCDRGRTHPPLLLAPRDAPPPSLAHPAPHPHPPTHRTRHPTPHTHNSTTHFPPDSSRAASWYLGSSKVGGPTTGAPLDTNPGGGGATPPEAPLGVGGRPGAGPPAPALPLDALSPFRSVDARSSNESRPWSSKDRVMRRWGVGRPLPPGP